MLERPVCAVFSVCIMSTGCRVQSVVSVVCAVCAMCSVKCVQYVYSVQCAVCIVCCVCTSTASGSTSSALEMERFRISSNAQLQRIYIRQEPI